MKFWLIVILIIIVRIIVDDIIDYPEVIAWKRGVHSLGALLMYGYIFTACYKKRKE